VVKAFIAQELELAKREGRAETIDKVIKLLPSVTRKDVPWKEERNSFRRYLLRRLATLKEKEVK
jgi:hypothetical protein